MTLAFQASATSVGTSVVCPAVNAGDLLVLVENIGIGNRPEAYPSGWTGIPSLFSNDGTRSVAWSFKVADGSEGGTSITGMTSGSGRQTFLTTFRDTSPWSAAVAASPLTSGVIAGNPSSLVLTAASEATPHVAVAAYFSSNAIDPRTFSPAADAEVGPFTTMYLKYKVYNSSPSNITIDMADEGAWNYVGGVVIRQQTTASAVASITEAGDTVASASRLALKGTLSKTEAADTVAAVGKVAIKGTLSATEAGDTASGTGTAKIIATLSATEAGDSIAATGKLPIVGTASVTEEDDTATGEAIVIVDPSTVPLNPAGIGAVIDVLPLERSQEEHWRQQKQEREARRLAIERAWDPEKFAEPEIALVEAMEEAAEQQRGVETVYAAMRRRRDEEDAIAALLMVM